MTDQDTLIEDPKRNQLSHLESYRLCELVKQWNENAVLLEHKSDLKTLANNAHQILGFPVTEHNLRSCIKILEIDLNPKKDPEQTASEQTEQLDNSIKELSHQVFHLVGRIDKLLSALEKATPINEQLTMNLEALRITIRDKPE